MHQRNPKYSSLHSTLSDFKSVDQSYRQCPRLCTIRHHWQDALVEDFCLLALRNGNLAHIEQANSAEKQSARLLVRRTCGEAPPLVEESRRRNLFRELTFFLVFWQWVLYVRDLSRVTPRSMNDLEPGKWGTEEDNNILKELTKKDKEAPKEEQDDKPCRNFSEQARSVPDIQETITEESKAAYTTFIEQPSLVSSLIPQLAASQPLTGGSSEDLGRDGRRSLRCNISHPPHRYPEKPIATVEPRSSTSNDNELALPPRTSKPKLVDKPRHVRKHPLLTQPSRPDAKKPIPKNNNIYQNCHMQAREKAQYQNLGDEGVDVFDGVVKDTNPFKSHANPFESFMPDPQPSTSGTAFYEEGSLVKDCTEHVSHEDLLEFADQKPCGRQRGAESDEVRVMMKVLNNQISRTECLEALELCNWLVHSAIKAARVRLTAGAPLSDCVRALTEHQWDETQATPHVTHR
ncbi:unnamed protein product [Plutella xylostella]|uniref:(diamondback moth) hypothetical protein n=1 Tax=Plutella xylostella TaxID=51655 RepID=A0A8S4GC52_PLUXY|nr:unnamed protein product [Plutella xylostella]